MRARAAKDGAGRGARAIHPALVFAAFSVCLVVPALANGYPLVFMDSGFYLSMAMGGPVHPGRAPGYPLLLETARLGSTLWTPVVLQALMTAALVLRATWVVARRPRRAVLAVAVALALASGLPKLTSWVMPDVTTGWILLGAVIWLRARHPADLVLGAAALLLAVPAHGSHLPLAAAVAATALAASALPSLRSARRSAGGLAAIVALCLPLSLALNLGIADRARILNGSGAFLVNRLVSTGLIGEVLDRSCWQTHWRLCNYQDKLRTGAQRRPDWFLFGTMTSPLRRLEPAPGVGERVPAHLRPWTSPELAAVARTALDCCALDLVEDTVPDVAHLLLRTDPDQDVDARTAGPMTHILPKFLPSDARRLSAGDQAQGDEVRVTLLPVGPVSVAGWALAVVALAVVAWRRGERRTPRLALAVLGFLLANATLMATVSTVHARYETRVTWLLAWVAALLLADAWPARARPGPSLARRGDAG